VENLGSTSLGYQTLKEETHIVSMPASPLGNEKKVVV
jgi:hypothetical protein